MPWVAYVYGQIVSSSSLRFIQNLLAATAATKMEDSEDSSDDSDAEIWANVDVKAGDMNIVTATSKGMTSRSADEGVKARGRHARIVCLGRNIWEPLPAGG